MGREKRFRERERERAKRRKIEGERERHGRTSPFVRRICIGGWYERGPESEALLSENFRGFFSLESSVFYQV